MKTSTVTLLAMVVIAMLCGGGRFGMLPANAATPAVTDQKLPRLLDIGAKTCIPCKMMAPVLDALKTEYAGQLSVEFLDVDDAANAAASKQYGVTTIPTQLFFDAAGKEMWRHEGFISKESILTRWKELGITLTPPQGAVTPIFERLEPATTDARAKNDICYMCDGTISAKTRVQVQTAKGPVDLCSLHCYFILYSSMLEDKNGIEQRVSVTDWKTGRFAPVLQASLLYSVDGPNGRPVIKAFTSKDTALQEQRRAGGTLVSWQVLQAKELANRCGFCDRAVYPEDAALVKCDGVYTWGCCSHCALGVAARTGKDLEIHERDRLTGEEIVIKTFNGNVASLEPKTAVAWFGLRKGADGKYGSAGCFHQGFFTTAEHLQRWVAQHPLEIGKLISIDQALGDKMKLSPVQIQKACKVGECAPK